MAERQRLQGAGEAVQTARSPHRLMRTLAEGAVALFLAAAAGLGLVTAITLFLMRDEVRLHLLGA